MNTFFLRNCRDLDSKYRNRMITIKCGHICLSRETKRSHKEAKAIISRNKVITEQFDRAVTYALYSYRDLKAVFFTRRYQIVCAQCVYEKRWICFVPTSNVT